MLDVCLLGTSGMLPMPGRYLTALMTRYNGSSMLIDCGEATQMAIKEKGWSFNPIDIICFTHYHADHISGLPGLLLTIGNSDRKDPVTLIGPKGLTRVVSALRVIAPELPYELKFIELKAAQLPRALDDVDFAVINSNYALSANLNPAKDSVFIEDKESLYANILVVRVGHENDPKIKALIQALQSDKIKQFIIEKYNGSVLPAF